MEQTTDNLQNLESSSFGTGLYRLLALFGHSNKMFWMGILLVSILQLIPVLPARYRTTGNIMSRTFAGMLFAPLTLLLMAMFPLLMIPGWASAMTAMSDAIIRWYELEDLV